MEEQLLDDQLNNKPDDNYYADRSRRVRDIGSGLGFGLIYVILSLSLLSSSRTFAYAWVVIVLYLIAILFFFLKKRHYISIGLILLVAVPLAIVGGCLLIIGI